MYNSIQSTSSAARVTNYVLRDKEDQRGDRVVFASGIGCSVETVHQDLADTREIHDPDGKLKVEAYSAVMSASRDEFDPDDPEDAYKFHRVSEEAARRTFPGRQALVGTQKDGESGLLHSHWVVSNIAHEDAEMVHHVNGQQVTEQVVAGRPFSSRMSNVFRIRAATNEVLADEDFMRSIGYDNTRLGERVKGRSGLGGKRFDGLIGEHAYDNNEVVCVSSTRGAWLENLRERIDSASRRAVDEDHFKALIAEDGSVELNERGKQRVWSYSFTDEDGTTRTARSGGKRLRADEGGRDAIVAALDARRREALEQVDELGLAERLREARTAAAGRAGGDGDAMGGADAMRRYRSALEEDPRGPIGVLRDADDEIVYEFQGTGGAQHRLKAEDVGTEFGEGPTVDRIRSAQAERGGPGTRSALSEHQRRIQEMQRRRAAELEQLKEEAARTSAEVSASVAQRSDELDAERTERERRVREVLDDPPAAYRGLSEAELASAVDARVMVHDVRLRGRILERVGDVEGMRREHGLDDDESRFLVTKWEALGRPSTAHERGDATPSIPAREPAPAAVGQLQTSESAPALEQGASRTASAQPAPKQAPDAEPSTAEQDQEVQAVAAPAERTPWSSRLRGVVARSGSVAVQRRIDGVAQLEEDYRGRTPDSAFEDRLRDKSGINGVNDQFLRDYGEHLDPEMREQLELRSRKQAAAREAYDSTKAERDRYLERRDSLRQRHGADAVPGDVVLKAMSASIAEGNARTALLRDEIRNGDYVSHDWEREAERRAAPQRRDEARGTAQKSASDDFSEKARAAQERDDGMER